MSAASTAARTDSSLIRAIRASRVGQREAIGHAGDVVHDLLGGLAAGGQVLEDPADDVARLVVLLPRVRTEVHPLEHEGRESIAAPTSSLWRMSPASWDVSTRSCTRRSMRRAPVAPSSSISSRGNSSSVSTPARSASSMSWLMYATRSTIRTTFLERLRLARPGVVEDAVADFLGQVEPAAVALDHVDDAQRVLVVPKPEAEALFQLAVRASSPVCPNGVCRGRAQPDRLDEILVQAERAGDPARDARRLERVGEARSEVVAQDRSRPESCSEVGKVWNARSGRGHAGMASAGGKVLLHAPPARVIRADGERREPAFLVLAHAELERVSDSPG